MLKLTATLLLCLLTLKSVSQNQDYPRRILITSNTYGVLFLDWQVKYINDHFILGFEECEVKRAERNALLDSCADIVTRQGDIIQTQEAQLALANDIVRQQKGLLLNSDKIISSLNRRNTFNKWSRNVLFVAGAFLGVKVLLK